MRASGTLTLQQDDYGDYIGTFVDDGGVRYDVEGALMEEGTAEGAVGGLLSNEETEFAFRASRDGSLLMLHLVPFDAAGQPSYDAAREFVLERQGSPSQDPSGQRATPPASPPQSPLGAMINPQPSSAGFAGTYAGALNGVSTTLTIQQQGATLQGRVDAGGYPYMLSGTASGAAARGTLSDPQTGGAVEVELLVQGEQLTLTLLAQDPYTGQVNRIPTTFQRGAPVPQSQPQAGAMPGARPGSGPGSAPSDGFERDPALVGVWSYTESMTSGDASMVTQMFLQVNPDGSYAYGNGRAVGGGAGWSGDTGYGNDVTRGKWRTQNSIVYIQEGGSPQWVPYARYYIEGGRMMFTFGDGSRQIWYRK